MRTHFSKLLLATTIYTLLIGFDLRGHAAQGAKNPGHGASPPAPVLVVPNFKGASDAEICKLRDDLELQQGVLRDFLLYQLEDKHLSPLGRVETIWLLGDFRPNHQVVTALIQNMNVIAYRRPDEHTMGSSWPLGYIARLVLANIGTSAEEEILSIIGSPQSATQQMNFNPTQRQGTEPSQAEGFAGVLTRIEGKQNALLKLRDAHTKAKDPVIKVQFQKVIAAVEKGERSTALKY